MLEQSRTVSAGSRLRLDDLIGNSAIIDTRREIIVGRAGTFVVGEDDEFLHRRLLHIWFSGSQWMVRNVGTRVHVDIEPRGGGSYSLVALGPGADAALSPGPSAVVFATTHRTYELHLDIVPDKFRGPSPSNHGTDATATVGRVSLNVEQEALVRLLTRPLRQPGARDESVPTVAELAGMLGWTEKKTHSKIENLCRAVERTGTTMPRPLRVSLARYALMIGWAQ